MVESVADRLGQPFVDAVELILDADGRVAVTGLGKSGLVGRKIAATLSSTGTPAFFVHAAEAHHGDAGMVLPADVMIAISNSGETAEVVAFAHMAHARGTGVIALVGVLDSALAREADVFLDIQVEREADPLDLAPTASTTVTMAMGDALSIALMVLRGYRPEDFFLNHPAGALGRAADVAGGEGTGAGGL
ncbi:MAG: KpsF/GutQ family sugar-phosphate isomerase [Sciscionella sp.]